MPKAKAVSSPVKKASTTRPRKAPALAPAPPPKNAAMAPRARVVRKAVVPPKKKVEIEAPPAPVPVDVLLDATRDATLDATLEETPAAPLDAPPDPPEPTTDAQSQVVASKFAGPESAPAKPRPTLPTTYGESHLLLLVRDPQTLFAAWDMSPSTMEGLKARLGRRGFEVSTLTLRLIRTGGGTRVWHVAKKARSRYLTIDGGPSYVAEIGFTTPAGRFEFVTRSAPCFVPMGPLARQESIDEARRSVFGYRAATTLQKRGGLKAGANAARARASAEGAASSDAAAPPRVLGGASDLYRR